MVQTHLSTEAPEKVVLLAMGGIPGSARCAGSPFHIGGRAAAGARIVLALSGARKGGQLRHVGAGRRSGSATGWIPRAVPRVDGQTLPAVLGTRAREEGARPPTAGATRNPGEAAEIRNRRRSARDSRTERS